MKDRLRVLIRTQGKEMQWSQQEEWTNCIQLWTYRLINQVPMLLEKTVMEERRFLVGTVRKDLAKCQRSETQTSRRLTDETERNSPSLNRTMDKRREYWKRGKKQELETRGKRQELETRGKRQELKKIGKKHEFAVLHGKEIGDWIWCLPMIRI